MKISAQLKAWRNVDDSKNGRGDFMDVEDFNGRQIFVRNNFSKITADSTSFEFSGFAYE